MLVLNCEYNQKQSEMEEIFRFSSSVGVKIQSFKYIFFPAFEYRCAWVTANQNGFGEGFCFHLRKNGIIHFAVERETLVVLLDIVYKCVQFFRWELYQDGRQK